MSHTPLDIDALVNELQPELLPEVVVTISDVIGYRATLQLITQLGGIEFVVPRLECAPNRSRRYRDMVVDVIGDELANRLFDLFGGERLYLPRCHAAFIKLRNIEFAKQVAQAVARGELQAAVIQRLAPQYGFTERWAFTVLASEYACAQPDLFN